MSASKQQERQSGSSSASKPRSRSQSILFLIRQRAIEMAVVVGVLFALSWSVGSLISPQTGAIMFVALVLLSVASDRVGEFSFTFLLSAVAVAVFLANYILPSAITGPFVPLIMGLLGFLELTFLTSGGPWAMILFLIASIYIVWAVRGRITSAFTRQSGRPIAANADTLARYLSRQTQRLVGVWREIFVAVGVTAISIGAIALGGVGELGAFLLEMIGKAPELVAALFNWGLGFVALDGDVSFLTEMPVLGEFFGMVLGAASEVGPTGFLILGGGVILLAWFRGREQD